MWPFKPYDLLRIAVADCFNALAKYLKRFESGVPTTENILEIRKTLETARNVLGTARIRQSAQSWMGEQLLVLIQDGDRLLGSVIALTELLETHAHQHQYRAVQPLIDDTFVQMSIVFRWRSLSLENRSLKSSLASLLRSISTISLVFTMP